MRKLLVGAALLLAGLTMPVSSAFADAQPPTNGGSANGNGASGQCTGDMASRPPSCHNGLGSGN